jgi:DNA-binding MarR family transcriptional regulator
MAISQTNSLDDGNKLIQQTYAPAFFGLVASRITDRILSGGSALFAQRGITIPGRSMSSLLLLADKPRSVTEIATALKVTHAASIKNTRSLIEAGMIERRDDPEDARRKPLYLTANGEAEVKRVEAFMVESVAVYEQLFAEIGIDLHDGLLRMEKALDRVDFGERYQIE